MDLTLSNTVQIITIIGFSSAVIKYVIVAPLQKELEILQKAINKLDSLLEKISVDSNTLERRLTIVEESTKAAHKRLDEWVSKYSVNN